MSSFLQVLSFLRFKLFLFIEKPTAVEVTSSSCPQISGSHITALKCNFTGRPKVNITWNHANEIQGIKTSLHYESSWLTWTVGIFNVTKVPDADAGYHIICIGKNQFGEKAKPTVLQVKCKYSFK